MAHYAAFDVSDKETAIHVLDEHGKLVWKGKRPSEPEALAAALRRHAPELVRVGLETGRLTPWLFHALKGLGVPVVCLDARHARAATALQRNKTDARDAETLAQLVRTGWFRAVHVKSELSQELRALLTETGEGSEARVEEWFTKARDMRAEWATQEGKSGDLLQNTSEEMKSSPSARDSITPSV